MSDQTAHTVRMFPALKIMERQLPPLFHGRQPYWRAPVTPPSAEVYVPAWNWYTPQDVPAGTKTTVLDANAAYLGALGNCKIAHSHLDRLGPWHNLPDKRQVAPGYYRITVPHWAFSGTIVSPLGDSARLQTETAVWVTAPTLVLLLELLEDGHLGDLEILDSWTAATVTDFQSWANRLKSLRIECMDRIDTAHTEAARAEATARYTAFKEGYSAALSMILTGERCQTRRPDWSHTVYAEHAAATWRKAWRYTWSGPLVSMGHVDEIEVVAEDLPRIMSLPKPPFRYDDTGRAIGAMKPKTHRTIGTDPRPVRPTSAAPAVDLENLL